MMMKAIRAALLFFLACLPALAATLEGPAPTADEIEARRHFLTKVNPGQVPPDSSISRLLRAEKAFQSVATSWPSQQEISARYEAFVAQLPRGIRVSREEAAPVLTMQLLLERRENHDRVKEALKAANQDSLRRRGLEVPDSFRSVVGDEGPGLETWPPDRIQIQEDPSRCLALDSSGLDCVLTVADFNRGALTFRLPKSTPLDSARAKLLDKSLNTAFYAAAARSTGYADLPEVRQTIAQRLAKILPPEDRAAIPDTARMKELYHRLYDSLFSEKEEVEFDLIGATDSNLVDSLYRSASRQAGRRTAAKPPEGHHAIPWRRFPDGKLPRELVSHADTLPLGGITPPFKVPYGFFILRVASIRVRPGKSFASARPMLYDLLRNGYGRTESQREKSALAVYKAYPHKFLSPDTILMDWWLLPSGRMPAKGAPTDFLKHKRPVSISSVEIPALLRPSLEKILREATVSKAKSRVTATGPIGTPWGTLYVRIDRRVPGGRRLPFQSVKSSICAMLDAMPGSLGDIPWPELQQASFDDALANSYWRKLLDETRKPTDEEAAKAVSKGIVPADVVAAKQPDDPLAGARGWLFDQRWRKPLDDWKAGLWLDPDRLLR